MKNITSHIFMLLFCAISWAQVGVGTLVPTAELDIATTNTGIPALELTPQTSPTGSVTGQLSVIGDRLYMYDATRGKWLTTEMVPFVFGRAGDVGALNLRIAGQINSPNAGPVLPYNGTIVAITANSNTNSISSNLVKEMQVRVRNGVTNQTNIDFSLVGGAFNDSTYNIDFNAGDHLTGRTLDPDSSGDVVNNPSVVIWIRWRQ